MKITGLIYSSGHTDKLKGDLGAISPNKKEVEGFLTVEAKYLGVNKHVISNCCRNQRPTAYGFKWKYTNIKNK